MEENLQDAIELLKLLHGSAAPALVLRALTTSTVRVLYHRVLRIALLLVHAAVTVGDTIIPPLLLPHVNLKRPTIKLLNHVLESLGGGIEENSFKHGEHFIPQNLGI